MKNDLTWTNLLSDWRPFCFRDWLLYFTPSNTINSILITLGNKFLLHFDNRSDVKLFSVESLPNEREKKILKK